MTITKMFTTYKVNCYIQDKPQTTDLLDSLTMAKVQAENFKRNGGQSINIIITYRYE